MTADAAAPDAAGTILHASCVAHGGRGLLILGPSGAGKSGLALRLMALGADLVADDRTLLTVEGGALIARCPAAIRGRIEARGVGILNAACIPAAQVVLAADLGSSETDRLPPRRLLSVLGVTLDLVLRSQNDHFPESLLLYLRQGRAD